MKFFAKIKLKTRDGIILICIAMALACSATELSEPGYATYERMAWALMSEPNREELMPTVILSHLNRAIELAPDLVRTDSYALRAHCWDRAGEQEKAIQDNMIVVEREPNNPKSAKTYCILAAVWGERKELQKALEFVNKSIELDPEYSGARATRAAIYRDLGMLDAAKEDLRLAIEYDPQITNIINTVNYFTVEEPVPEKEKEKGSVPKRKGVSPVI